MRIVLTILMIVTYLQSQAQWTIINGKQRFAQGLGVPVRDTASGLLNDSAQIVLRPQDSTIYFKYKGNFRKISTGGGGGGTFTNNIIMNAGAGNRLGYWVDGQTIPVAGKTLDEAFQIITQKAIAPSYNKPVQSTSGVLPAGTYEIGTNLGTITFSTTYTQNDGGARNSNSFKRILNGVYTTLPSNTDTCSSLITARSYKSYFGYDTGACKNNNLGVLDCTGRIVAGNDSSGAITYTPVPSFYWGYLDTNLIPTSSQIRAKLGGDSLLTTTKSRTYTVSVGVNSSYLYLAYPKNLDTVSSILMNNFETIGAFSPPYEVAVTNSKGYTQTYYVYLNRNPYNVGSVSFIIP